MTCFRPTPSVPPEPPSFTAVILAGQRAGQTDPLAEEAGVSQKCMVPIGGQPLIRHVAEAIGRTRRLARVRICVEPGAFDPVRSALAGIDPCPIDYVAAAGNLADSVIACAEGLKGILLITTADNVLLTPAAIEAVLGAHDAGAEVVAALTTRDRVLAAHPDGQRRFYRFADDSYSNCNLYGLNGERALRAAEVFRSGGQFAKNPARIAIAFGLLNLLLVRFALVSLPTAMKRISRRLGVRTQAVVLEDGSHAIDVDNQRTYAIVAGILEARKARPPVVTRTAGSADSADNWLLDRADS